jgi:hypothetical protein
VEWWIRENADRIVLALIGLGAVVIGVVFHAQQFLGTAVILTGIGVLLLAVLLRRTPVLGTTPKGVEIRLDEVESELEAVEEELEQVRKIDTDSPSSDKPVGGEPARDPVASTAPHRP